MTAIDPGTVLVTGATGNIASGLIPALRQAGITTRALVRDESKAQLLRDQGVQVFIGDLDKPESLDAAFAGIDKVYLITSGNPACVEQASNAIAAAKKAGRPHIVRQSALIPEPFETTRLGRAHAATDKEIKESGLPFTLLQPTFYMQNIMMGGQTVAEGNVLYMPFKDGRLGMLDVRDIVESAYAVLTTEGHEGKTYRLTGPASISLHDVATALTTALGREITYTDVPPEMGIESMVGMGFPQWVAEGYVELFVNFANNGADLTTDSVQTLTGHAPRSIDDFARDFAPAFGGPSPD